MTAAKAAASAYTAATEATSVIAEAGVIARSEVGVVVETIVLTALTEAAVGTASAGIGIVIALRSTIHISIFVIYTEFF